MVAVEVPLCIVAVVAGVKVSVVGVASDAFEAESAFSSSSARIQSSYHSFSTLK